MKDGLRLIGRTTLIHKRKGVEIGRYEKYNLITNLGKDDILNIMFHGDSQIDPWFIGLIDNAGFSAVDVTDIMSSHSGWAELTSYDEATRVEWVEDAASLQAISNTTLATFTISATVSVKGIFVTSNSTKAGTTGTLWAATTFTSVIPAVDNDTIDVIYTVAAG